MKSKVLVIVPLGQLAVDAVRALSAAEHEVKLAYDVQEALALTQSWPAEVMVSGLALPGEVARRLESRGAVLMAPATWSSEALLEEVRLGLQLLRMKRAVLGPPIRDPSTEPYLSATSPTRELLALARQVANAVDTPVVIQGESGAGKKVLARFIHQKTPGRQQGPFVVFNCGAVSAEQLEGELFGTEVPNGEPGQQFGALAAATGGTLVLEELAMLPMAMQPRLLRVLDWGCYRAAGATQDQECDVRLIVSTCGDLEKDVRLGRLRLDLLHRLNVFQLEVLPLRERQGEVLALAELFLGEFALKRGRARQRLDERAQEQLLAHDFPGNVRELRNAIERAVIIESGPVIGLETLSLGTAGLSATGRGFDAATRANEVGAAHLAG